MHSGDLISIGEFAGLSRLSVKALRHYDDQGLLSPVQVDPITRYRFYERAQIERATLIGTMRRMDVPLSVIREVLDLADDPESAVASFHAWWLSQERRHRDRQGIGRYVTQQLRNPGVPTVNVLTRSVPERKLAVLSKELFQPELERFIMEGFTTLFQYAERHPGLRELDTTPEWPTYVVFHGPVTPDQSAIVELAIVVAGDAPPEGDIVVKLEPAHDEAYVEVTKAGLSFPQILDAYDAVARWVNAHGTMLERLASREVYIANVMTAADDDHVCDVAFPFARS
jgi:DNA-binding transcriptional MerR regulator